MWFTVSNTILALALPPAGILIIIAAGFVIIAFCRFVGKLLIFSGFLALYLLSITPVSDALLRPLETFARPFHDRQVKADAIVVLGGGATDLSWVAEPAAPSSEALARLVKGIILYRRLHIPLVLAGGNGRVPPAGTTDAEAMKRAALALGVPSGDILIENMSQNTVEAAQGVRKLIPGRRILLVTSAYHLKRATGMFRKNDFSVIPVPAVYFSEQKKAFPFSLIPHAATLHASSAACREYLSLFWYDLTGEI